MIMIVIVIMIIIVILVIVVVIIIVVKMLIRIGAPRNPAPRKHFLARIVKPSGCRCRDGHLTSRVFTED